MLARNKKICLILFGAFLLGLYLYKAANFHASMPSFLTKRLADRKRKVEISNNDGIEERKEKNGATLGYTRMEASAHFKKALKCLTNAKRNIATYLRAKSEFEVETREQKSIQPSCSMEYTLIILVTTRPGSFANRAAIRLSWGRMDSFVNKQLRQEHENLKWKSIFSVGLATSQSIGHLVSLESSKYDDILRLPYKDSYKNLPNKTMNSLEWIANNCKAKFILKTDDDCFVNIFQVLPWLNGLPQSYLYIGKVNTEMPVIRDPKHRNFVSREEHKMDYYKPYCAGGGYILRGLILKNITEMGKRIKQIINEDAYMGMLTNALGIVPKNDNRFLPFIFFGKPLKDRNMCEWKDQFLMHNVFGKHQLIMHFNSIAMTYFHSLCEHL